MVTTQMIVTMLIGVVAPMLVGLITKASTSGQVKGVFLALVSAAVGIGQGFIDTPPDQVWDWQTAVFYGITSFIVGVGTYFGLLAPKNSEGSSPATVLQGKFIKDKPLDDTYIADAA